jgi:hypothetical protein
MEITGDYEVKTWVFSQGIGLLGIIPTIDLFSHNLNHKLPRFVSMPGPLSQGALSTDAFSHAWTGEIPYIFPPVQLLGLVFQKIIAEQIMAVVVLPKWPSLPWWTMFLMTQIRTLELGPSEAVLLPELAMTGSSVTMNLPQGLFLMALVGPSTSPPTD